MYFKNKKTNMELEIFEQTAPLVKFYEDKGVLYKIDANGSINEVWERLLKVVNE